MSIFGLNVYASEPLNSIYGMAIDLLYSVTSWSPPAHYSHYPYPLWPNCTAYDWLVSFVRQHQSEVVVYNWLVSFVLGNIKVRLLYCNHVLLTPVIQQVIWMIFFHCQHKSLLVKWNDSRFINLRLRVQIPVGPKVLFFVVQRTTTKIQCRLSTTFYK